MYRVVYQGRVVQGRYREEVHTTRARLSPESQESGHILVLKVKKVVTFLDPLLPYSS